jgi:uncharacterized protein
MQSLIGLICGLIFGAGLAVSGMTNPEKVLGFLDLTGRWDPTLAVVMGSALCVSTIGFAWARRLDRPWFAEGFAFPTRSDIDANLIGGAALFGIGWGLVGLCPGPAIANLARGSFEAACFVAAMGVGMWLNQVWAGRAQRVSARRMREEA